MPPFFSDPDHALASWASPFFLSDKIYPEVVVTRCEALSRIFTVKSFFTIPLFPFMGRHPLPPSKSYSIFEVPRGPEESLRAAPYGVHLPITSILTVCSLFAFADFWLLFSNEPPLVPRYFSNTVFFFFFFFFLLFFFRSCISRPPNRVSLPF